MKLPELKEFQKIYSALQDDVSKQIYKSRLLYSLTGDDNEIRKLVYEFFSADSRIRDTKICYYGAGGGGLGFTEFNRQAPFVIDRYKTGFIRGIPIISLDEFLRMSDCKEYLIIITVGKLGLKDEIATELTSHGLRCILGYPGVQYFDLPELELKNEYFADIGAEDGETSKYFLEHFENGYAYVLEPNPKYFEMAKTCLGGNPQAELFSVGAYDQNAIMRFDPMEESRGSSRISETGELKIKVQKLDDLLKERPVTFLKMDIEGSELAALRGAEQIIQQQRPKLAICVYHRPEDIWKIPNLILKYHPDYKLYLRHYSLCKLETVLYAI